jgi:hypothetical protein
VAFSPHPGIFLTFVANKVTYTNPRLGGPCVILGWRLGGPWATQGPPNPKPNPKHVEGRTFMNSDCCPLSAKFSKIAGLPGLGRHHASSFYRFLFALVNGEVTVSIFEIAAYFVMVSEVRTTREAEREGESNPS